jgi:hypothetical protein
VERREGGEATDEEKGEYDRYDDDSDDDDDDTDGEGDSEDDESEDEEDHYEMMPFQFYRPM